MRACVASSIVLAGCWSGSAPPAIVVTPAPEVKRPREPLEAELGAIDAAGAFHPTRDIALFAGSVFGWRIHLPCTGNELVRFREELRVPAAGDWDVDPSMTISADQRTATVRSAAECNDGSIAKSWTVSPGDPAGLWTLRVTVEGYAPQTFRARFASP
jgi:hypothetical protein